MVLAIAVVGALVFDNRVYRFGILALATRLVAHALPISLRNAMLLVDSTSRFPISFD